MNTKTNCPRCQARLPAHYPACTAVRSWRVDGPIEDKVRTFRWLQRALGFATTEAMHRPIGTRLIVSHAVTGPYASFERLPARRVLIQLHFLGPGLTDRTTARVPESP